MEASVRHLLRPAPAAPPLSLQACGVLLRVPRAAPEQRVSRLQRRNGRFLRRRVVRDDIPPLRCVKLHRRSDCATRVKG